MKKPLAKARGKAKRPNKVDFLKARGKPARPKPFENNKVDFSKFKTHPPASDIAKLALPAGKVWPQPPQVPSPTKTVGLGVTKLNLGYGAGDFVTRATTPYVHFSDSYNAAHLANVDVRFDPSAYGITSVANYVITFNIYLYKNAVFTLQGTGYPFPTLNWSSLQPGWWSLQVPLQDISPSSYPYAVLMQRTLRAKWTWFFSAIKYPDIVLPF